MFMVHSLITTGQASTQYGQYQPVSHDFFYLLSTMHLLTHVLCQPTRFFQLFIDAMFNSLQTSFSNIMKDWPDKRHAWVTPSTRDDKTRVLL